MKILQGAYGDGVHDDTMAIQELLDKRGEIYVPDGMYLITRPLIIHDNTYFRASKFAHFRLGDHAQCSLMDNDGLYERRTNTNITVEGGIWDGNNEKQQRKMIDDENVPCDYDEYIENQLAIFMIRFVHTKNLTVKNVTFKDPSTYAIHIADAEYFKVTDVTLDYNIEKLNMDGVHIQGPARFGVISNVCGDANDDHVALCANGTTRSEVTRGAIEDIVINGVYSNNGYTGVRLLSSGDPVRNISISNIHGRFRFYGVSFTHHYPLREDRPVLIENVHISDVCVSKSDDTSVIHWRQAPIIWVESGVHCRNVLIENVYRREDGAYTTAPTLKISKDAVVENFHFKDCFEADIPDKPHTVINETDCKIF